MKLEIEYIQASQLGNIEHEWKQIERGKDMTIFQSYEWNCLLAKHYVPQNSNNYESVYVIIKVQNEICLIAPMWIIKKTFRFLNKKGVYLLGRDSYSDYLNIIYKDFIPDIFDFMINSLKKRYKQNYFVFEHIKESTDLYSHIVHSYHIIKDIKEPCVSLLLPSSIEEYHKLLSKHSRQNIRTAGNRLIKDKLSLLFEIDDREVDKKTCLNIRESKLSVKYEKISKIKIYKYRLVNKLLFRFSQFIPMISYKDSRIMTATINNHLCAFFNYVYDYSHKRIVIISAGTDLTYARYSPGVLLMYNFIKKIIEEGEFKEIDFTRGNEPYKHALGGSQNYNHMLHFTTNK